jgi:hypothetical protein
VAYAYEQSTNWHTRKPPLIDKQEEKTKTEKKGKTKKKKN